MVEGPRPGREEDWPDPSRHVREDVVGLERPQSWSLVPGKQMGDSGHLEPLRQDSPADGRKRD